MLVLSIIFVGELFVGVVVGVVIPALSVRRKTPERQR